MKGGYLRVMYPAPEVCLHLAAWQEFCGFDLTGQNGWFDIAMADGAIRFAPTDRKQPKLPDGMKKLPYITDPAAVAPVEADPMANTDFYGNDRAGKPVLPGPFVTLGGECVL